MHALLLWSLQREARLRIAVGACSKMEDGNKRAELWLGLLCTAQPRYAVDVSSLVECSVALYSRSMRVLARLRTLQRGEVGRRSAVGASGLAGSK